MEDIYYMQLQGSGLVRFSNGQHTYFAYAGTNQQPYRSIGKYIKDNETITLRNISMEGIKSYLKYHPEQVKPILFTNPSYVFFDKMSNAISTEEQIDPRTDAMESAALRAIKYSGENPSLSKILDYAQNDLSVTPMLQSHGISSEELRSYILDHADHLMNHDYLTRGGQYPASELTLDY